jgi:hypothetical protein
MSKRRHVTESISVKMFGPDGEPLDLLDDDSGEQWICTVANCQSCRSKWVAVHPHAERIQCPGCGHLNQVPPLLLSQDEL